MKEHIAEFWRQGRYAVVGVSRSGKGFGCLAYRTLKSRGYEVYPVNGDADVVLRDKCYRTLADLPQRPNSVLVVVPAPASEQVVQDCGRLGIRLVWLQQGAESPEGIRLGERLGLALIHHACALMFLPGTSLPHACHRLVVEVLGKAPR